MWERRTALYAATFLIRRGEVDDAFALAELMFDDDENLVQKAAGTVLRWAGDKQPERLRAFVDEHAPGMPPTMLRTAIEKLDNSERAHYRALRSPVDASG